MGRQRINITPLGRLACAAALALTLAGCSSTPDWANPVEWYKGTAGWLGGDDKEAAKAREAAKRPENAPPDADKPYPKISSVPARPTGSAGRAERRKKVQNALVADRDNANHVALGGKDKGPAIPSPAPQVPPAPAGSMSPTGPQVSVTPVPVQPAPSVYPPAGSNPAFQAAIAQQTEAGLGATRPIGPIRRNTIGVPPTPKSGLVLTPPGPKAVGRPGMATGAMPPGRPVPVIGAARTQPIATVLFANNSDRISDRYISALRSVIEMQRKQGGTIKVIGHASSRTRNTNPLGHRIANFRISMARAKAVAQRLVRLGAPAGKIEVSGVADSQPIYQEIMPLGEAGNRRAEIYLEN